MTHSQILVRVSKEDKEFLELISEQTKISITQIIRDLIKEFKQRELNIDSRIEKLNSQIKKTKIRLKELENEKDKLSNPDQTKLSTFDQNRIKKEILKRHLPNVKKILKISGGKAPCIGAQRETWENLIKIVDCTEEQFIEFLNELEPDLL